MEIGIGVPLNHPDVLLQWGISAEAAGFSTVAAYDRLAWTNAESLTTLAVLAGATSRIRLQTQILIGPLRSTALLGAQAATLDRLSGGRFTLGMAVGDRTTDYAAAGVDLKGRGARFDEQIVALQNQWAGDPVIGPTPSTPGGPPILIGGVTERAVARVARHGLGFISALPPQMMGDLLALINRQWVEAGRPGRPRIVGQLNTALGSQTVVDQARAAIADYYVYHGISDMQVEHMATTPQQIRDTLTGFEDMGVDEVILFGWSPEPSQVDRLTDATGDHRHSPPHHVGAVTTMATAAGNALS